MSDHSIPCTTSQPIARGFFNQDLDRAYDVIAVLCNICSSDNHQAMVLKARPTCSPRRAFVDLTGRAIRSNPSRPMEAVVSVSSSGHNFAARL